MKTEEINLASDEEIDASTLLAHDTEIEEVVIRYQRAFGATGLPGRIALIEIKTEEGIWRGGFVSTPTQPPAFVALDVLGDLDIVRQALQRMLFKTQPHANKDPI